MAIISPIPARILFKGRGRNKVFGKCFILAKTAFKAPFLTR